MSSEKTKPTMPCLSQNDADYIYEKLCNAIPPAHFGVAGMKTNEDGDFEMSFYVTREACEECIKGGCAKAEHQGPAVPITTEMRDKVLRCLRIFHDEWEIDPNDMGAVADEDSPLPVLLELCEELQIWPEELCRHHFVDPTNEIIQGNGWTVCIACGKMKPPPQTKDDDDGPRG